MFDGLWLIGDLVFLLTASLALVAFWLLLILSNTKPTFQAEFRQRVSQMLVRRAAMVRLGTVWDHAEVKVNLEVEIAVPKCESQKISDMLGMPVAAVMTPAQRLEVERLNRMYEGGV
jgi:hypothetical protein